MLYDDIMEAAATGKGVLDPLVLQGVIRLAQDLKDTPKYVLSEDVLRMVVALAEKRPASLESGLPICVLPHPKIWVEASYEHMIRTILEVRSVDQLLHNEEASNPTKIGYLIEEVDEGFVGHVVWLHEGQTIAGQLYVPQMLNISLGSIFIDVKSPAIVISPKELDTYYTEETKRLTPSSYMRPFQNSPQDVEAFLRMRHRNKTVPNRYMTAYTADLISTVGRTPEGMQKIERSMQHDLAGEWRNMLAILMVLNSKTCIHLDRQDRSKLSKSRVKRGKPPTYDHTVVNFYLSRVQANRMATAGMRREDLRKHLVAAHLKVRKTGVFLWSAHVRGYVGEPKAPIKMVKP